MRAAIALACFLALACGRGPATPDAAVERYFRALPRDPVRAYLLLDPAVHRAHGLRVPLSLALRPANGPPSLPGAQVGWLDLFKDPWLREQAGALAVEIDGVSATGDAASVRTRVRSAGVAGFEQVFRLRRDGSGASWRIVAIEQSGVGPGSESAAFAAAPSAEGLRRLRAARARAAPSP